MEIQLTDYHKRITAEKKKIGSLLENAAEIARRVLSSIQALAGTKACKGVQITRLKEWALNKSSFGSNFEPQSLRD